ncbi:AhpC/TSA family protein [Rubripirellula tenax]|uniref:AhpC/TSA family protein n=1 Tax=Rubripirellula tenax TaxID=2528015 RepID=A0A5C6F1K5_9BACT|nr:peroxiredoxin family protein [Rubripirellula tenax]TWU54400.1 AhpC/TSA family protein [Rubripirellula tenax]
MKSSLSSFAVLATVAISLAFQTDAPAQDGSPAQSNTTTQPATGSKAQDFKLTAVAGSMEGDVRLSELLEDGPVVLVVLRGFPGYQCGICSRQVGELMSSAKAFAGKNAKVVMVYPGADDGLEARAREFLKGSNLPEPFSLLIDPGYEFTNAYGLRWNAPRETAYPSTFVIGTDGVIKYANISKGHGGRTSAKDILANL